MKSRIAILILALSSTFSLGCSRATTSTATAENTMGSALRRPEVKAISQQICPICGMKVDKHSEFVDVAGKRIYACSMECAEKVKANPAAALQALAAREKKAQARLAINSKLGHLKGAKVPSNLNSEKSGTYGLPVDSPFSGSPWAMSVDTAYVEDYRGDEPFALCEICGHIKGLRTCCEEGVENCETCRPHKGSTGCCYKAEFTALPPVIE